jgi:hypothetical protein
VINIFAQADAYIGTSVEMASHLRLPVSMLNITVKKLNEGMSSVDKVLNVKISSTSLVYANYMFQPTLVIFRCL